MLVELENGSYIAAPIAVVGGRPHSNQRLAEHILVALHDKLVRSRDEFNLVGLIELPSDIPSEQIARPPWR